MINYEVAADLGYTEEQVDAGHVACGDCGKVYGYVYQPQVFHKCGRDRIIASPFDEECNWLPLCDTDAAAIDELRKRGWGGNVLRYALDARCFTNGERNDVRPWLTAGEIMTVKGVIL